MPATKGNKPSKMDKTERPNKKQQHKDATTVKGLEVDKNDIPDADSHCVDCGKSVQKTQAGLLCDACGFWHHAECEDVSDEVYAFLCEHSEDPSLAWYCRKCSSANKKLVQMMMSMRDQHQQVEEKVNNLEINLNKKIEEMMGAMSGWIDDLHNTLNKKLDKQETKDNMVAVEEKVSKLVETMEKQRTDTHELKDCVQDAVREKLQEDKEEADDIKKRSANLILHGLPEVAEPEGDTAKKDQEDQVINLLHAIKCDEISILGTVRLGRYDKDQTKPRPVKVVVASEQLRERVLKQAKNLKDTKEKAFEKVFIHRDLTVKQRQKRHSLVQELKQRQQSGEKNLMIYNDKIVVKRQML